MARTLLDRYGNPVQHAVLTREVSAATIGGVRSPMSGTPADGLNPVRLANILREADQGNPVRYLELAEVIEERDPHYLGVIGTRKRSVSQIEISVEAASDAPEDVARADMVRDWLKRDKLTEELFDILDAIGKGYSFTEIIWDTSEGQWRPGRLEYRDPRWFRFDRADMATPVKLDDNGGEMPLDPFKFVYARMSAKSGLALRSGLARVAAWGWMFKAYTQRDWAIFTQTYGQPLRVGKYGAGASDKDRETLFRAVANIAGDCAAIVPESMTIDFVETGNVGASSTLYLERADWLDQQISKAVLGQTATTDAIAGGHAIGREHRQVQTDIETADANALAAILNRDLIRPWVDLEFGPQKSYPRLRIARPAAEDLTAAAQALGILVPLGLRVSMSEVRDKFGWADPGQSEVILAPSGSAGGGDADPLDPNAIIKRVSGEFKRGEGPGRPPAAPAEEGLSAALPAPPSAVDLISDRFALEGGPAMAGMLGRVEAMLEAADSLEEFRAMLLEGFGQVPSGPLADVLSDGLMAAHAAGRVTLEEDSGG